MGRSQSRSAWAKKQNNQSKKKKKGLEVWLKLKSIFLASVKPGVQTQVPQPPLLPKKERKKAFRPEV
jgi:hypothetical protein